MLKRLKRLMCRHSYMWSERRQAEVCCHCGRSRRDLGAGRAIGQTDVAASVDQSWTDRA